MAAYRRLVDLVTCRLTACTPGSALGPTLGVEYGKPLPFIFYQYLLKIETLHQLASVHVANDEQCSHHQ